MSFSFFSASIREVYFLDNNMCIDLLTLLLLLQPKKPFAGLLKAGICVRDFDGSIF